MTETIEKLLKENLDFFQSMKKSGVTIHYNFEELDDIINDLKDSLTTIEV